MKRLVAVLLFLLAALPGYAGTTYYVRPTNGDDSNAGTSFAAAFKTTQKALDTAAGGDEIRLCAEAVEAPTATVDIDGTYGTSFIDGTNPLHITGASSTDGSVDGTMYTLSGSALGAGVDLITVGANADWVRIDYVRFTAATRHNLNFANTVSFWSINNCRFDNATNSGLYSSQSSSTFMVSLSDCEIDNNGAYGSEVSFISGRGFGFWNRCSVHDNISGGIQDGLHYLSVTMCLIYDNGGAGLYIFGSAYTIGNVHSNVFFNNNSHGLSLNSDGRGPLNISNNVFRSNNGYGIYTAGGANSVFISEDYNCFSNNTSGTIDSGSIGANSITSDPKFTSETDGSEDFTPQSGSPLLGAGIDGGQW